MPTPTNSVQSQQKCALWISIFFNSNGNIHLLQRHKNTRLQQQAQSAWSEVTQILQRLDWQSSSLSGGWDGHFRTQLFFYLISVWTLMCLQSLSCWKNVHMTKTQLPTRGNQIFCQDFQVLCLINCAIDLCAPRPLAARHLQNINDPPQLHFATKHVDGVYDCLCATLPKSLLLWRCHFMFCFRLDDHKTPGLSRYQNLKLN